MELPLEIKTETGSEIIQHWILVTFLPLRSQLIIFDPSNFKALPFKHFIDLAFDNIIKPIIAKKWPEVLLKKIIAKRKDIYFGTGPVQIKIGRAHV